MTDILVFEEPFLIKKNRKITKRGLKAWTYDFPIYGEEKWIQTQIKYLFSSSCLFIGLTENTFRKVIYQLSEL